MEREQALALMNEYLESIALRNHSLASESVLKALAKKLELDDKEIALWGLAGLLHDLDYEKTQDEPNKHGLVTVEILEKENFQAEFLQAIKAHNAECLSLTRESKLDFALTCGEVVTGLLVASVLVRPEKDIEGLQLKSVVKKFKDKSFARTVNREHIKLCEKLDISLNDFIALAIGAMIEIKDKLVL